MHSTNARTGQHRNRRFHDHRQIDANAVALPHAKLAHGVGKLADACVQIAIGHLGIRSRVIAFPEDRHLIAPRRQMPIEAGDGGIQHPILKPLDRNIAVEIGILDFRRRLHPGDALGFVAPEGFGVLGSLVIHGGALRLRHTCLGDDFGFQRDQFISHAWVPPCLGLAMRGMCVRALRNVNLLRAGPQKKKPTFSGGPFGGPAGGGRPLALLSGQRVALPEGAAGVTARTLSFP